MGNARTITLVPPRSTAPRVARGPGPASFKDMVWVPGGTFRMGSDDHYPEEAPARDVGVDGFWMSSHPVTNLEFGRFTKATGYVTLAERPPNAAEYPGATPELLVAGSVVFQKPEQRVDVGNHYLWWSWIPGANWRHPEGPGSTLHGRERHPVVHVAYEDAEAYAAWAGTQLPTEVEWERAARGGLDGMEYAWGSELAPRGRSMANTWQGDFPWQNLLHDKYEHTSPVGAFPANGYGLYDMIGNVWELTADWYQEQRRPGGACCGAATSHGDARARSVDPRQPGIHVPRKVMKGGSYLCAPNYCRRYRPAARMAQPIDTSTCHAGFRCIIRAPQDQV